MTQGASIRDRVTACIPALQGWTSVEKGIRLAELVVEAGAELSVELGVFGGRGVLSLAIGHACLGRGHVVGIDPWIASASLEGENDPTNEAWWREVDHQAVYRDFLAAAERCSLLQQCWVMRERSDVAVKVFADRSVGVLHQDGNHSEAVSTREVELWAPKLARGGCWVADDTDWRTTRRAQEALVGRGFALVEDHESWRIYRAP